ncbi:uncharacterized protein LOC107270130 [Cephus cinctus]|uniref:Uncharacterized protein LOC107270130 n=1 Tax=Cephus cinctus TaxID=211228 RepID=A0AAJ7C2H8_CEPCN|nr:uncharacterized protein LOC107270130 [Cephus cinctus]
MASRRNVQNTVHGENRTFHYSHKPNDDGSTASTDVFLEASLQFLHQLLAERYTQDNHPDKDTDLLNDQVPKYDQCLNYVKELLPNLKLQNTSEFSQNDRNIVYDTLNSKRNVYSGSLKSTAQGYESEIESASSLSLNFVQNKCQNCAKQVPVEVHVMMNKGQSSASRTTLLIKLPNAIKNFLRNKPSKKSVHKPDSDVSVNCKGEVHKGNRFTKSFMRLLKGKKTSASMVSIKRTMNSEEILTPRTTKSNFESTVMNHNNSKSDSSVKQNKINCAQRSCFSLKHILEPQEAIASNIFQEKSSIQLPVNNKLKNEIYVTIKPSMMETDVTLETCTIASENESPINNRILNTESESIIPIRYVQASSQISQNVDEQSILEKLERFWSMNKNTISSHDKNYSEIPVEIKTASNPLILEKQSKQSILQNSCESLLKQDKNADILLDKEHQTKVLLEMAVGTLPIGINTSKNLEHLKKRKIMKDTESLALEVLLRHIFIDNENYKVNQPVEKDIKREQILPKRQLSKISICSSSGSLSYTEHDMEKQLLSENSWQMDDCNMECESNVKSENNNLLSASNDYQRINNIEINLHESTTSFHPLLSKQSSQDQRELVNAMIRWWGPQVNYTTWPLKKRQTSSNSVSTQHLS